MTRAETNPTQFVESRHS